MTTTDIQVVKLELNTAGAEDRLKQAEQRFAALDQAIKQTDADDVKGRRALQAEIKKVKKEIDQLTPRARTAAKTLESIDRATPKELKATLKELTRELNSGNIARGSKEWDAVTAAIRRVNEELGKIKTEQKAAADTLQQTAEKTRGGFLAPLQQGWAATVAKFGLASMALNKAKGAVDDFVNAAASMDEAMADVRKYTGLTAEAVDELNEAFKQMKTRTSREQLNALAADAGRLGIQGKENILGFVRAADTLNTALGADLGEDAVKNIGKLAQMFGEADQLGLEKAMLATGSTINELAQSSSAAEGYIMEFTSRLAGVGKQAGMTQAQIMGLAAVLDQNQVNVEKGATAVQNIITLLYSNTAKIAKIAGLDVQNFTELLKKDANAALITFAEALNKAGKMDAIAPMLKEMNLSGAGVTQVLTTLAAQTDNVRESQRLASQAYAEGTSVLKEANAANSTLQARLEMQRKSLNDLKVEVGNQLVPVVLQAGDAVRAIAAVFVTLIKFVGNNYRAFLTLTAGIAAYKIAMFAATNATKVWNVLASTTQWITLKCAVAYNTMTGNATRAAAATRLLNEAVKANPFVRLLSIILSIGGALATLVMTSKKAAEGIREIATAEEALADVQREANKSVGEQMAKITSLTAILHNNNASLAERGKALEELKRIVPGYTAMIDKEGKVTNENTAALKRYREELMRVAMQKAAQAKLEKVSGDIINQEGYVQNLRNVVEKNKKALIDLAEKKKKEGRTTEYTALQAFIRPVMAGKPINSEGWFKSIKGVAVPAGSRDILEALERDIPRLIQYEQQLAEYKKAQSRFVDIVKNSTTETINEGSSMTTGTSTYVAEPSSQSSSSSATTPKTAEEKAIDAAKLARLKSETEAEMQYRTGLISYENYRVQMADIALEYDRKVIANTKDGTAERYQAEKQFYADSAAQAQTAADINIQMLEAEMSRRKAKLTVDRAAGLMSEQEYNDQLEALELDRLRRIAMLREREGDYSGAVKAQAAYEKAVREDQLKHQEEFIAQADELMNKYLDNTEAEANREMALLNRMLEAHIITAEQMEAIKKKMAESKKPTTNAGDDEKTKSKVGTTLGQVSDPALAGLISMAEKIEALHNKIKDGGKATWEDYAAVAIAGISTVSAALTSVSNLFQAQQESELAALNKRYEGEIDAVGKNTAKGQMLEQERKKKEAEIKTKYNKKQMKIEVAQAIAQVAMNALIAYGSLARIPIVGPALGAAAAAAAVAAGMIQVAAIKKQHEAEAAGYYSGGFTGGKNYKKEAGVVHEGEFVANHEAVNNPRLSPVFTLLDQAQKNNRVAALTTADVSRAIGAPYAVGASNITTTTSPTVQPQTTVNVTESKRTAETLSRLEKQIAQGITAKVYIDGADGLAQQLKRYERLTKR